MRRNQSFNLGNTRFDSPKRGVSCFCQECGSKCIKLYCSNSVVLEIPMHYKQRMAALIIENLKKSTNSARQIKIPNGIVKKAREYGKKATPEPENEEADIPISQSQRFYTRPASPKIQKLQPQQIAQMYNISKITQYRKLAIS